MYSNRLLKLSFRYVLRVIIVTILHFFLLEEQEEVLEIVEGNSP